MILVFQDLLNKKQRNYKDLEPDFSHSFKRAVRITLYSKI